ncbi:hypothetical protein [Frankia sp. Cj3]|uniref:hypothetical protein n=1 Tax=Frankia sp. Cj3 TaxID=2880976 RepID=UPI001EF5F04A|nr:hypothetical protein [Frankia sp. Cj3]
MTGAAPTMSSYSDRRQVEWKFQLGSLRVELEEWRHAAAPDGSLAKHHSQLDSLVNRLSTFVADVEDRIAGKTGIRADLREQLILDSHVVWDYFRTKFVPRFVPWQREFLQVADEFTWACYRPAFRAWPDGPGKTVPKGPPLVFLNRNAVPFAQPRDSRFTVRNLHAIEGGEWSSFLPFPLVGLPWFTIRHLPGLLLAAHEVGHHIEDDLNLTGSLQHCVAVAGVDARWRAWIGEIFADVCGCLFAGEAYAGVLQDALVARADLPASDNYPQAQLRIQVCIAVLDGTGAGEAAARQRAEWREHWPAEDVCAAAGKLVKALLAMEFEELPKRTLVASLGCAQLSDLARAAGNLLWRQQTGLTDPRAVLAAAGMAFRRDPQRYDDMNIGSDAVDEIRKLMDATHRGESRTAGDENATRQYDEAAGHWLFERIASSHRDVDPADRRSTVTR